MLTVQNSIATTIERFLSAFCIYCEQWSTVPLTKYRWWRCEHCGCENEADQRGTDEGESGRRS